MLIKDALKEAHAKLSNSSTPALDARVLLSYVLDMTHEQLLIGYNDSIDKDIEDNFFELISRRENNEPIAYIVKSQEFYGREFIVDNNVLIPRSETELLIDSVLENENSENVKILDLGTGSGIIAVTLAKEIKHAKIVAVDICPHALDIAKLNAVKHSVQEQIIFKQSNWYDEVHEKEFDYIVSNPPYISPAEDHLVAAQTKLFEPHLALYAKDDGMHAYIQIIKYAVDYLKNDGKLLMEIGFNQFEQVQYLLKQNGFHNITLKKDLANQPRIVIVN